MTTRQFFGKNAHSCASLVQDLQKRNRDASAVANLALSLLDVETDFRILWIIEAECGRGRDTGQIRAIVLTRLAFATDKIAYIIVCQLQW